MARPIDYSKWKDIEISDDEDDTHPNIDTPSLFKWRHEARVQRMEEFEEKKKEAQREQQRKEKALRDLREETKRAEKSKDPEVEKLKKQLDAMETQAREASKKAEEVQKEERLQPWNVDTISSAGFDKTVVNKQAPRPKDTMTDEERESHMKQFVKKYESKIKEFGWLKKFDDSKVFLQENTDLACEETANYLVIQCINLAMEEKFGAMEQVAHQVIAIQYLIELSKQLDIDPRACISSFFSKIQTADPEYRKAFDDELAAFKDRIRRRAKEKVEEQMEELRKEEEEERLARLGPGGLDPAEVFESLPKVLQECFESQDIGRLQQVIRDLPEDEARLHMKRCVDSGLWKPAADDPNTNPEDGFRKRGDGEGEGEDEEIYEEVGQGDEAQS